MMNNIQHPQELRPGTSLYGGKYVILCKIAQGGFGITYKAVQRGLDRTVCIKEYFLSGRCVRDINSCSLQLQNISEESFEKYRLAFVKEAKTLAALHHPGVVEVIDIFDENNTSYMVMPFIEGRTLQNILDSKGPIAYPEAVNYIAQVADAVGYIHERHILHRDIKPDNIMITADHKAVLIDFGSAREYVEDKTQSHTSMLTHGYAPPEQYSRTSRKGSYTDIYAIGATFYFILTGCVPTESTARFMETMPEPRELKQNLPREANRTILKAMQLKPQDRYQNISEFMDDLCRVNSKSVIKNTDSQLETNSTQAIDCDFEVTHKTKKKKSLYAFCFLGIVALLALGVFIGSKLSSPTGIVSVGEDGEKTIVKSLKKRVNLTPRATYVLQGDTYETHINMVAYDELHQDFTATIDGQQFTSGDTGTIIYRTICNKPGRQSISGTVYVTGDSGVEEYSFNDEYYVAKPAGMVYLDRLQVMYAGLENPVTISAATIDAQNLSLSVEPAGQAVVTKDKGGGCYNVKPKPGAKKLTLIVKATIGKRTTTMGSQSVVVKDIPAPIIKVSGVESGGRLDKKELSASTVVIPIKNPDFLLKVDNRSIRIIKMLVSVGAKEETVNGPRFNESIASMIRKATKGEKLVIQADVMMPDGKPKSVTYMATIR